MLVKILESQGPRNSAVAEAGLRAVVAMAVSEKNKKLLSSAGVCRGG